MAKDKDKSSLSITLLTLLGLIKLTNKNLADGAPPVDTSDLVVPPKKK